MRIIEKMAFFSAYDKTGVAEAAGKLAEHGWRIRASGGTAKHIAAAGVPVIDIGSLYGEPILDKRVITLRPQVLGGLLAKDTTEHHRELAENQIVWCDLVYVDLYPLEKEIAKPDATLESVIKEIDIGGVTLISSGAKGQRLVACCLADLNKIVDMATTGSPISDEFREQLAAKADYWVFRYRALSAIYRGKGQYASLQGEKVVDCRYGENPWQAPAALYSGGSTYPLAPSKFKLEEGKPLSYINWTDLVRSVRTIAHINAGLEVNGFSQDAPFIALVVKHGNVCGAAVGDSLPKVLMNMIMGDQQAMSGGTLMTNSDVGETESDIIAHFGTRSGETRKLDVVAAPSFSKGAVDVLRRVKGNCRFMANPALANPKLCCNLRVCHLEDQDFLSQPNYTFVFRPDDPDIDEYGPTVFRKEELDAVLAWAVGSTSNSNTQTAVRDGMVQANAVGQQSRVLAAKLLQLIADGAGHSLRDSVVYSDSFYPFDDGPKVLADAGVKMILTSSGSVRDEDTIKLCKERGISLWMIPDKKARGFYGHA